MWKPLSIISLFLFLPPVSYVAFGLSSMTAGFAVALLCVFILSNRLAWVRGLTGPQWAVSILILLVFVHIVVFLFSDPNAKAIGSLLVLSAMLVVAVSLRASLEFASERGIRKVVQVATIVLVLIGLLGAMVKFPFWNYDLYSKPVFPFSEPSHYALFSAGFFYAFGVLHSFRVQVLFVLVLALLSVSLESTILAVLAGGYYFLFLVARHGLGKWGVAISGLLLGSLLFVKGDFSYFVQRLTLRGDVSNLTALVYLQGWEQMLLSLKETSGIGYGFQNITKGSIGDLSEQIYSVAGRYKNREDGGFLAAKVVSEFGLLGVIIVLNYVALLVRSLKCIIKTNLGDDRTRGVNSGYRSVLDMTAHAVIVAFAVEMFGRSFGYFSFGVLLLLIAVLILYWKTPAWARFLRAG